MSDLRFEMNPDRSVDVLDVGNEHWSVVVIDDAMLNPEAIVEFAATRVAFAPAQHGYYPGIRAPLPDEYVNVVYEAIRPLVREGLGIDGELVHPGLIRGFALATTPPEELKVPQRCPHADAADPHQLAMLHYLCEPKHGGTSFYRHRETGFESLDAERIVEYRESLNRDWRRNGVPPAEYLNGDNRQYERIASVESKFNRIVFYRGMQLHSADIDPKRSLGNDPRKDRLTATFFPVYASS